MSNSGKKITAFFLALCFSLGQTTPVYAAESASESAPGKTLRIQTPEDLLKFSLSCTNEGYSQNLTVSLTGDIDLAGVKFLPIPIFCGSLDGGGHTISGLNLTSSGSNLGLFRYLSESATVKNLHVSGFVEPDGTQSTIGILAGKNEGSIQGCTGTGTVVGDREVGGLVGKNSATGVITGCTSDAAVTGKAYTGGIAGLNEGTITGCANTGPLNGHNDYSYTDTGGIAGRSSGLIENCENRGEIGYEQNGYNSGGIAGFHSGILAGCQNHGAVLGRKDIGGIAGQFEPNVDKLEQESKLDKLDREMESLSNLFREFSDTLENNLDTTKDNVDDLRTIMDDTGDIIDSARNEASDELERTRDKVEDQRSDLEDNIDSLVDNADALGDSIFKSIQSVQNSIAALRKALNQAKDSAGDSLLKSIDGIEGYLDSVEGEMAAIGSAVDSALAQIRDGAPSLGQSGTHIDISGPLSQAQESVSSIVKQSAAIAREVAEISDQLAEATGKAADYYTAITDGLSRAISGLNRDVRRFGGGAADSLGDMKDSLADLTDTVSDQVDSSKDRFDTTSDSLSDQMDAIQNQIDYITDNVSDHSDALGNVTDRITDQLDTIRDIAINEENSEFSVDDISSDWDGNLENGSIVYCANTGDILGDYHVGGIAGMMAHEMFEDPEVDLDLSDTLLGNVTALVRATLRDDRNSGSVTAKNDYAGGIVGRADVGAVIDAVNTGNVETTDGNFCGGIAGASNYIIARSHSLSVLTGNDSVGGIAGKGRDIQDCYSMTTILSQGEKLGAIAGKIFGDDEEPESADNSIVNTLLAEKPEVNRVGFFEDDEDEDTPDIHGNYFIQEEIAGIDGINYTGQAEPLAYNDFIKLEGLPEDFLQFGVTFVANGKVIHTQRLNYGDSFDTSLIPPCPDLDGQVGEWQEFDPEHIVRNVIVQAEYAPWLTSISSGGRQPILLVEGSFSSRAEISFEAYAPDDVSIPTGDSIVGGYSFVVTDQGKPVSGQMTIRVRSDSTKGTKVLWVDGTNATPLDFARDGNYLVTQAPGNGSLIITEKKGPAPVFVVAGLAALAIVAGLILVMKKRKKTPVKAG